MRFRRKPQQTISRRPSNPDGRTQVFSYHAQRSEQEYNIGRSEPRGQDTRHKQRAFRHLRERFGALLIAVVILVCLVNILRISGTPKIIALTSGTNNYFLRTTQTYQAAAAKLFANSALNDNKITIDTQAITKKLKQMFPELADVSITLPLVGHRPVIYIAPTTPALLFSTSHGTYLLDNTGKALINTNQDTNVAALKLPTVIDQSGLPVKIDEVALPSTTISFIRTITDQLQAKGINTASLALPAAAYELDVKPGGVGYSVKFNLHSATALQQVGTYLAVRQRLGQQGITPASYIDVRLDGRAYYK